MRNIDLENEKDFENKKAGGGKIRSKQSKYYWATSLPIERHKLKTLNAIKSAKILEIGCASGYDAVDYCNSASAYIGVDISNIAIDNCKALKLGNADFYCVDGHKLPIEDKSVDYVIVNSLLHHLDLETSFKEISRVLSDHGALIFREPLGTNPIIGFYRMMTPSARTIDERPFTFSDLKIMGKYFHFNKKIQWFGFLSIFSAFINSVKIRAALTAIDEVLSRSPIRYLFWQFSGVMKKKTQ